MQVMFVIWQSSHGYKPRLDGMHFQALGRTDYIEMNMTTSPELPLNNQNRHAVQSFDKLITTHVQNLFLYF
jgi:hypothetical protein